MIRDEEDIFEAIPVARGLGVSAAGSTAGEAGKDHGT